MVYNSYISFVCKYEFLFLFTNTPNHESNRMEAIPLFWIWIWSLYFFFDGFFWFVGDNHLNNINYRPTSIQMDCEIIMMIEIDFNFGCFCFLRSGTLYTTVWVDILNFCANKFNLPIQSRMSHVVVPLCLSGLSNFFFYCFSPVDRCVSHCIDKYVIFWYRFLLAIGMK